MLEAKLVLYRVGKILETYTGTNLECSKAFFRLDDHRLMNKILSDLQLYADTPESYVSVNLEVKFSDNRYRLIASSLVEEEEIENANLEKSLSLVN
jgi:hypothetical protein